MIGALAIDEGATVFCVCVLLHNRGNAFFLPRRYKRRLAIAAKKHLLCYVCHPIRRISLILEFYPSLPFTVAVGILSD